MTELGGATPARRRRQEPLIPDGPVRASANVCQAAGCLSMGPTPSSTRLRARHRLRADRRRRAASRLPRAVRRRAAGRGPRAGASLRSRHGRRRCVAGRGGHRPLGGEGGRAHRRRPFFSHQVKVVLEHCGRIDPERIEDYMAAGGYEALHQGRDHHDPRRGPGRGRPTAGCAGGAAPATPPASSGATVAKADPPTASTSSATATRATPAPSWTAASWRATRTACSRAWPSPRYAVGATQRLRLRPRRVPAGREAADQTAIRQAERAGPAGRATSSAPASASTSRCASAPAPSSAARRPR